MNIVVITPPAPVVTLEEAKAQLRVDFGDDDAFISGLIAAVQGNIDGPDGWLGRAIGVQTLEMRLPSFCGWDGSSCIPLRCPPVTAPVSVKYIDGDGVEQTFDSDSYRLVGDDMIAPAYSVSWPSARHDHDSVKIRYTAGYEQVPPPIKAAILLNVAHLYANREAVSLENFVTELPLGVQWLLSPFRRW
ncbi:MULTISPECIES: head-tail connector protein [unclassified Mesorhizobium]|uniref:head-tail connector protein n=1 Tax=unclassified Mesorhizobium TaxID=325217 RepID=UPI00112C9249|nr:MULTISPECIES: head-tail connector protein [unclassified Mesorhizobium]MCA0025477.1 head-tail connector protein [Mesorhizobium sp. B263B1A]TPJ97135.1 phage gp6-like head-tail connector protein [Mesorhizobium sp. B2-5-12]TPK27198.1 phage gp6-like head-tail connector protein [Mesorhizobium sp. B2-5-6]